MLNNYFKRTLLSSALGLMLGFQSVQDASATVLSYTYASADSIDYTVVSGDPGLSISFEFADFGAYGYISSSDTYDPGTLNDFGFGSASMLAYVGDSSYGDYASAEAYADTSGYGGAPVFDYLYSDAAIDSSASAGATQNMAVSGSYLAYTFTVIGSGVVDIFAPFYYEVALDIDTAGECGTSEAVGLIEVFAEDTYVSSDPAASHQSITNCGATSQDQYNFFSPDTMVAHLTVTDGQTGLIYLSTAAFTEYFPEFVAELPLPASFGMMLVGLLMLLGVRRQATAV